MHVHLVTSMYLQPSVNATNCPLQAEYKGVPQFAKLYNFKIRGSKEAAVREVHNFETLRSLQGHIIPRLNAHGFHPGTVTPCLVMDDVGEEVPTMPTDDDLDGRIKIGFRNAARDAIQSFHEQSKCCHGDLVPSNLLVRKSDLSASPTVCVIDLASMHEADERARAQELADFMEYYM